MKSSHGPTCSDAAAVPEPIDLAQNFGWGVGRIAHELGVGHGTVQRALDQRGRSRWPTAAAAASGAL
jgi:hypothetical protein